MEAYTKEIAVEQRSVGPGRAEPYAFCGRLLFQKGESERAVSVLRQGLAADAKSFVANFELGRVLLRLGSFEEAEQYLVNARSLVPNYARTYYLLGQLHLKQNRRQDAAKDFEPFDQLRKGEDDRGYPTTYSKPED